MVGAWVGGGYGDHFGLRKIKDAYVYNFILYDNNDSRRNEPVQLQGSGTNMNFLLYYVCSLTIKCILSYLILRFCQDAVAVVEDISKMYNAIRLGELEQHTHRFVWRNMDSSKVPNHYVIRAVDF